MKIDTTEQEKLFHSLSVGLTTFVSNTFAQYEEQQRLLIVQIQKLQEENGKLKDKKLPEPIPRKERKS